MTSPPLPVPSAAVPSPRWSAWRRFALHAGTLYLSLYFLIGGQPLLGTGFGAQRFAAANGLHSLLFGRPLPPYTVTGSGDTAFDWTFALMVLGLALVGGWVWTRASRRDPSPAYLRRLEDGLRVVLAVWLTAYALPKFSFGQFGLLHTGQLLSTYGESSPMGLLWRFMAASPGYQYVAGVAELLPALLLQHRRPARRVFLPLGGPDRLGGDGPASRRRGCQHPERTSQASGSAAGGGAGRRSAAYPRLPLGQRAALQPLSATMTKRGGPQPGNRPSFALLVAGRLPYACSTSTISLASMMSPISTPSQSRLMPHS